MTPACRIQVIAEHRVELRFILGKRGLPPVCKPDVKTSRSHCYRLTVHNGLGHEGGEQDAGSPAAGQGARPRPAAGHGYWSVILLVVKVTDPLAST